MFNAITVSCLKALRFNERFKLLMWPLVTLSTVLAIWGGVALRNSTDRATAEHTALRDAATYALSYEQFLTRSVSQMDHVTMHLKYDWEQSRGKFRFEDLVRQGMFSDVAFISASIYDRNGVRRTTTRAAGTPESLAQSEMLTFHKNNNSTALRISLPSPVRPTGPLQFSRRLDEGEDGFDGVVVMVLDATYFTTFYNLKSLGSAGFIAMLAADGDGQIRKAGPAIASRPDLLAMPAKLAEEDHNAVLQAGDRFRDGQPRILAWQRSRTYPFVSVVGLSHAETIAGTEASHRDRVFNAVLASIVLAAFAAVATYLSHQLRMRRSEEEAIRLAYRTATDHAHDGFYMLHPVCDDAQRIIDFSIVDCNERGAWFFSMTRSTMIGTRLSTLASLRGDSTALATFVQAMTMERCVEDVQMPLDTAIRIAWARRTLVRAGAGLAVTMHDISPQKLHENQLQRLANEDALTGLPNRYWLLNYLPQAIACARREDTVFALLFVDLDGFKHVNDTQGHAVGDALLTIAAQRLQCLLRPGDRVVRFGGDEFIVLLDPLDQLEQASQVAQRLLDTFNVPFEIGTEVQQVGASVGISVFPRDGDDPMTLIKHSDIAMYAGKSEGKGQFRYYQPLLYERLRLKIQHRQELAEALEQDQLLLYFQPRVDTMTGELRSMEALVRWLHPKRGMIPPLEFIPLAESSGLIVQLGEIVMQKACRQIAQWRRAGLPLVPVSINVSPTQFSQGKVHRQLAACLALWQVSPTLVEIEITESAMMGEQSEVLAELSAIRALGVKLHIDDFGTGYSSLSQLQKLKMDVLKVDRAFTLELGNSKDGKIFFQAIVSMAHALGMDVVAEGVETTEQLAILQTLRCNEIQGYLISRPVPANDMALMLESRFLFPALLAMA